jgi:hypothetical protein
MYEEVITRPVYQVLGELTQETRITGEQHLQQMLETLLQRWQSLSSRSSRLRLLRPYALCRPSGA